MDPLHSSDGVADSLIPPFNPLIRLRVYRRHDLTSLQTNVSETFDISREVVLLRPVVDADLEDVSISPEFERCLLEHVQPHPVKMLEATEFVSSPVRVGNIAVAASLGLWKTTQYTNEIIQAARRHFLRNVEEKRRAKKSKLPIRLFIKFLNKMRIDVVVMSKDRNSVIVRCANIARRRASSGSFAGDESLSVPDYRTLLAFEFDPVECLWTPLLLPVLLQLRKASLNAVDESQPESLTNLLRTSGLTAMLGDLAHSYNVETMMFDRTVYNPQRVPVNVNKDVQSLEEKQDEETAPQLSPFTGMRYPNIIQVDLQLMEVFRRGLHPSLQRNRIRFLVTFFVAIAAFIVGLILIIYLKVTLKTCCYDTITGTCLNELGDTTSGNACSTSFCNAAVNPALAEAVNVFLFGNSTSAGRFLLAAICSMFVASLMAGAVCYFTTRTIAREKSRPLFYRIMMAAHIIIGLVASGFSAYVVAVLSHTKHNVPCSLFGEKTAESCSASQTLCMNARIEVRAGDPVYVPLVLCILFLFFSIVELLASLLSPMPDKETLSTMQGAKPETYVFYPSVYAPDGMSETDKKRLRGHIGRRLRTQLQEQADQYDILLTRSATIGEMMLANREKSLMGAPNQRNHVMNPRYWMKDKMPNPIHYMSSYDDTNIDEEGKGTKDGGRGNEHRQLPSHILAEVMHISSRIQASGGKTAPQTEL